ncbi:hypothetical protein DYBT9275_00182 [Dyadobacter sp. CECT 9275]|uniref:Uncharacterized protein n=1 Tax=Dyadobacter helix TaxID=2822344 RepID=A0A916N3Y9_9BACT|nr:hypothetical protein [Dyadobacter sp. CECT 9275]CAG4988899.1 hypothetical protein DYBT9275_00182 [Dyadobacter sp. CECT 9275]
MKNKIMLSLTLASLLMLSGCGGKKEEEEKEEPKNAVEALQSIADKAKEMSTKEPVDPVDFRKLKELLPEKVGSLTRTEATGEKTGAMGFTVSTAQARYQNQGGGTARIEIVDTGGIAGATTMALAAWSMADIDKETASGYEKTTTLEGHKAFEKYDNESKSGELNVLVADRYIVNVHADQISSDEMKDLLKDIDLDKLSEIK